jgi:hypothetical protein
VINFGFMVHTAASRCIYLYILSNEIHLHSDRLNAWGVAGCVTCQVSDDEETKT